MVGDTHTSSLIWLGTRLTDPGLALSDQPTEQSVGVPPLIFAAVLKLSRSKSGADGREVRLRLHVRAELDPSRVG